MQGRSLLMAVCLTLAAPLLSAQEHSPPVNYQLRCAGCHGQDGMGVTSAGIPPFPGFIDGFFQTDASRLYLMHVPGINTASLTDAEIAGVMNYVAERWGSSEVQRTDFTTSEVTRLRAQPVQDVVALRRTIIAELTARGWPVPAYPWP
jgi:cytochrome c553